MRYIDIRAWSRREHFTHFATCSNPHFSVCTNLDLTKFYPAVKQRKSSFTVPVVYTVSRAANAIPELRYRIRGEAVVEHAVVNPSTTILVSEDLFSFCTIEYTENFRDFTARAAEQIASVRLHLTLEDDPERDDLLFMSPIPWVSFTSIGFPGYIHPCHSIPQFIWGKLFNEGKIKKMPFGIQAHHALVDGIHVGRFYEILQDFFHRPEHIFGEA